MGCVLARRTFVQHYDTEMLDASLLVMPLCKFIAPGRLDEARLAFKKMLTYANHVGLYSEER